VEICQAGGYAAVLDMNEELANEVVKEWPGKIKFFEVNVLETKSIAAAVKGALEWVEETGKEVGGVIAAAGVSTPAKVSCIPLVLLTMNLTKT
jgi:3-hydroxyacyl-CoA dehydrogenase / 3-hydroxy-2-methylbutyryl-CoA dehydrogenase